MAHKAAKTEDAVGAGFGAGPAGLGVWLELMAESTRFVTDRLQQDLEAQQEMLACTDPAELVRLQTAFYQKAVQQYSDEAARMFGILTQGAGVPRAKRTYDDVPL